MQMFGINAKLRANIKVYRMHLSQNMFARIPAYVLILLTLSVTVYIDRCVSLL